MFDFTNNASDNPTFYADLTNPQSNPFRNTGNASCSTSGLEWMTTAYDDQGRATKVTTADNAEVNTAYELAASGADIGTAVTVTDQAGKSRRSITNALGQLKRVDEPNSAGSLGTISSPNQSTSYSYDTLNNLTTVNQGSQTRTFTYDALSRLKQAANPESGTIAYVYDNNGNLTQKTDARNVQTNYAYDALNRVVQRSYAPPSGIQNYGATAAVSYTYDNVTNAKGRLTKVLTGTTLNPVSATEYTAFDILGRVTAHKQTTDGNDYLTSYAYNLSGELTEETYPNGRVVRNTLDANGDLAQVSSQKNSNFGFQNYAGAFSYTAAGAVSSMRLGNGRWESTQFNARLQPTEIRVGNVQNSNNLLNLVYSYNTANNADNNGNVISQTITVPTVGAQAGFTATQSYTYDSLNRIKDATEDAVTNGQTTSIQTWKQTFTYDRYGNRTFDEANTTTLPKNCGTSPSLTVCTADRKVVNPTPNTSDNRLSSSDNYAYDYAGNTTADAQGRTFTYDAENKQTKVTNSSGTLGEYLYDGDGKRVKKLSAAEETIFVYDAQGKMIAEYSTALNPTPQVSYLTSDHLGSPRINTDEKGAVIARHDYQPFGEEINQGRNTGLGYQTDAVRKQFTGYEKDQETDLDFAQARYFNSSQGRFTQVDPIMISVSKRYDPQEINVYVYCRNNPLRFVDSTGATLEPEKWSKEAKKAFEDYEAKLKAHPDEYKDELATIEQLRKSDVNYVVNLSGNSDFSAGDEGKEGGLTADGDKNTVFINLSKNGNEKFSLFSRFGHEFEHARQFDSGEFAFAWDKDGKYLGRANGDISEEVKAWKVQSKLSNATDKLVPFATGDVPGSIMNRFDSASSDKEKTRALVALNDGYAKSYELAQKDSGLYGKNFKLSGIPPGTKISKSDVQADGRRYFGRTSK